MSFDRRQKIRDLLEQRGGISLKELESLFPEVSSMTLRRDIEYFESTGEAVRVRGGMRSLHSFGQLRGEDVYAMRLAKNQAAKEKIAGLAVSYIETGRSLYMDSGTTMLKLAKRLPDNNLSIVTSSPYVALEVSLKFRPTVNLIGGLVNRDSLSVSGPQSLDFVKGCNFDIAFVVPSAFSIESGFSCGNYNECVLKKHIVQKAKQTIAMVDSSKFERSMPFSFAALGDVDILLTDQKPSDIVLEAAAAQNVLVRWE
ncbi:MAG: DeoR/GlpR transcriptional regulator [Clostridia bacterium]|nr:DeoR/GlpR transcriptional regulator [Clostridia bacterium]